MEIYLYILGVTVEITRGHPLANMSLESETQRNLEFPYQ